MAEVDWHSAGEFVGRDLAEQGGTAILDNVGSIGLIQAILWLDGVLDGLHERGIDAKSIAISRTAYEDFIEASGSIDETYRGIILLDADDGGARPSVVVAA
ncbi:hypothetical protein IHQ71_04345 [Rhizobium sp. TH2]|uniref:hypothetical protein n=1 Tax=Rhizobium sp. TH2 TaxID=2775403 RepID=UPI0021577997|nr:hypothetical protein [Rhizobium sp. TH2]UVC09850.1 hypothetical protein IHQ71_04345 [Rhizobium sp. TH2]